MCVLACACVCASPAGASQCTWVCACACLRVACGRACAAVRALAWAGAPAACMAGPCGLAEWLINLLRLVLDGWPGVWFNGVTGAATGLQEGRKGLDRCIPTCYHANRSCRRVRAICIVSAFWYTYSTQCRQPECRAIGTLSRH
ncbi:hypothetical protein CPT_Pagan_001 [Xanthomonas phage Pagan]|uniref:Uncharacterized protein n=1 Tax=Xanthomonas phage Pagan TaxID=2591104 RepID=A0A5B9N6F6_9CAUD|nr:hypothetical protein CPT_Pagan_001 [Xanthomonas phage Pagan]